ncbi:hypothetical protein BC937DRAFT_88847 [Endogone sp. FLAS-F59071]|nr:hypothetical protein BC937DRAFT_88847 [Endogone sp. FLAS-F59071]|eukprot:RUS18359.1 hypothetical protein BC937DRAFT_88847 [Endogone sp. FLAS-F59071]
MRIPPAPGRRAFPRRTRFGRTGGRGVHPEGREIVPRFDVKAQKLFAFSSHADTADVNTIAILGRFYDSKETDVFDVVVHDGVCKTCRYALRHRGNGAQQKQIFILTNAEVVENDGETKEIERNDVELVEAATSTSTTLIYSTLTTPAGGRVVWRAGGVLERACSAGARRGTSGRRGGRRGVSDLADLPDHHARFPSLPLVLLPRIYYDRTPDNFEFDLAGTVVQTYLDLIYAPHRSSFHPFYQYLSTPLAQAPRHFHFQGNPLQDHSSGSGVILPPRSAAQHSLGLRTGKDAVRGDDEDELVGDWRSGGAAGGGAGGGGWISMRGR